MHLDAADLIAGLTGIRRSPADRRPHPDMQLNLINARLSAPGTLHVGDLVLKV